jgi:hypothetical protein
VVKYKYKVLKRFGIFKTEEGEKRLAKNSEEWSHSSRFKKGTKYVDYKFPSEDLEQDDLTEELVDKGYIKLVKEKQVDYEG